MIDEVDLRLIQLLQKNGRLSHTDLGKELNVVEGTVRRRIKRLVDTGIVKISAVPNLEEIGYGFIAIVGLRVQLSDRRHVANFLASCEQVCFLTIVTGQYDLMAIVFTHNSAEYNQFVQNEVFELTGVMGWETYVSMDIIKGKWLMADIQAKPEVV
jgi:Lrp/AsnC family transcriptional regulator, regulator for asnA, asnC and gidA